MEKMFANNALVLGTQKNKNPKSLGVTLLFLLMFLVVGEFFSDLLLLALKAVFPNLSLAYSHFDTFLLSQNKGWLFVHLTVFSTLINLVIPFGVMIFVVFFWVSFREKRPVKSLGFSSEKPFHNYFSGFALGFFSILAYCLLAELFHVYEPKSIDFSGSSPLFALTAFLTLPGWVIQSGCEEILIRGWLFQATSRKSILIGILVSSTVFTLIHLGNSGLSVLSLLNLFLYGLFAILYALKNENLLAICGFHASWNWAQGNVFGILVSGTDPIGGHLFDLGTPQGSSLLTGGTFGAEGSVFVTFILLGLLAHCLYGLNLKKVLLQIF